MGCGNGVFMIEVIKNQGHVVGLDYSKKMLEVAQERLKMYSKKSYQLVNDSATKLPFGLNNITAPVCSISSVEDDDLITLA